MASIKMKEFDINNVLPMDNLAGIRSFCAIDIETTGFSPEKDSIIAISGVMIRDGVISERYTSLINPGSPISSESQSLTGISNEMLRDAPTIEAVIPEFLAFVGEATPVGHNFRFDMAFLNEKARMLGLDFERLYADTLDMSNVLLPDLRRHDLVSVAQALDVPFDEKSGSLTAAECTARVFLKLLDMHQGSKV